MTTYLDINVREPLLAKVVVEIWQKNHIMGEHKRVKSFIPINNNAVSCQVWEEQYLIIRAAKPGEQF